jgi:hypothetical protein
MPYLAKSLTQRYEPLALSTKRLSITHFGIGLFNSAGTGNSPDLKGPGSKTARDGGSIRSGRKYIFDVLCGGQVEIPDDIALRIGANRFGVCRCGDQHTNFNEQLRCSWH